MKIISFYHWILSISTRNSFSNKLKSISNLINNLPNFLLLPQNHNSFDNLIIIIIIDFSLIIFALFS